MAAFKIGKVVMQSLFKKPATLMYPVIPRQYHERTRGQIAIDIDACILCGICDKKCPTDAIKVDRKAREWKIERMRCIQCNCCAEVCPKKCLVMENLYTTPDVTPTVHSFVKPEEEKPAAAPKTEAPAAEAKAEEPVTEEKAE